MLPHSLQGTQGLVAARSAFRRAHARARWRAFSARLLRRCAQLCSLTDALEYGGSGAPTANTRGVPRLMDVEVDKIVGSLGRANDYTAEFLPRVDGDEERWARVMVAVDSPEGVPPVDLYELDGEYYVADGHHRVSVLKRLGVRTVEAYVTSLSRVSA